MMRSWLVIWYDGNEEFAKIIQTAMTQREIHTAMLSIVDHRCEAINALVGLSNDAAGEPVEPEVWLHQDGQLRKVMEGSTE